MNCDPLWDTPEHQRRWDDYLIQPEGTTLVNKVGATTPEELRAAENDLLEYRLAELREHPDLIHQTYDLDHLKAIHRQLFQDVYHWAGDLRTVGIAKGEGLDNSFIPPANIEQPIAHVAQRIAQSSFLRNVSNGAFVDELTYLYDYVNFAHPFREGNGRTQREFFAQLLAETGRGLNWNDVNPRDIHEACHEARVDGNRGLLKVLLARILTDEPAY